MELERPPSAPAARGRRIRLLAGSLPILLLIALLAFGLAKQAPDRSIDERLQRGGRAEPPPLELPLLQTGEFGAPLAEPLTRATRDGSVDLRELRGNPVVINFWASWCGPCRDEGALLARAWRESRKRAVVFLGVNEQDLTDDAQRYIREFGISYPNVRSGTKDNSHRWGATGYPETFFVSARGDVVAHVAGAMTPAALANGISAAVSGRPGGTLPGGNKLPAR